MNNQSVLPGSAFAIAVITSFFSHLPANALSLPPFVPKPVLQEMVLTSPNLLVKKSAKIIKIAYHKSQKRRLLRLVKRLKRKNYQDIYFTKKSGTILEAEACKNEKRYFLQIARDGEILQATRFDSCITPEIEERSAASRRQETQNEWQENQNPDNMDTINRETINSDNEWAASTIPHRERKTLVLFPNKTKPLPRWKTQLQTRTQTPAQMLRQHGYKHIYSPGRKALGVMACKNGIEYRFEVFSDTIRSWHDMKSRRTAFGKCFGYGKQILNKTHLLTIMRRHGDTNIRIVRGQLPMFEAYSCLKGQRRHVKINRWGNDNVKVLGRCS